MLRAATLPALAAVPGLAHGFEQRLPGAAAETRDETRARVARALAAQGRLLVLKQVHGCALVEAPWEGTPEADASLAAAPGQILGIETADCLPALLVDARNRRVAAAHAGWRGAAAGVVPRALSALVSRGARPDELLVGLGPAIGACCYEVGEEVRSAFGADAAAFFRPGPNGRPHLDLRGAVRAQLESAGVPADRIHDVVDCTRCRGDLYPSYRRDGAAAGRMLSFVGFRR